MISFSMLWLTYNAVSNHSNVTYSIEPFPHYSDVIMIVSNIQGLCIRVGNIRDRT